MRYTKTLASLAVALFALPAFAATFPDVPEDHWAYEAVRELTQGERKLLGALGGGRFQGNQPFTRYQLAQTLQALIDELEVKAKTSLAGRDTGAYRFGDVAESNPQRASLLQLANRYHLYEGVPGLDPANFHGDKTVSRYELAVVIDNLMRQAEARDVVRVSRAPRTTLPFTDLPESHWAKPVIKSVYGRYGVMVGFPDDTFRGTDELTRYQFAAAAKQTVPLIHALVQETLEQKAPGKTTVASTPAIDETPWDAHVLVGLTPALGVGIGLQGTQNLGAWFVSERLRLLPTAPGGFAGELGLMGGYNVDLAPGWRLRPSIGVGGWGDFGTPQPFTVTAGYGLGLEWQPTPQWSFGLEGEGRHPIWAQRGLAGVGMPFLPSGQLRAAYHPMPGLALQLGAAAWGLPQADALTLVAGPTAGLRWRF